jgi:MFS family permease
MTIRQEIVDFRQRFRWAETFAALKSRNYRLWFFGQMISLFGTWMQTTAQGFLVFELTHSPVYLGYVAFASGIPTWLFMLYAGVVADRMPRRSLLLITQTAMMILAFILACLTFLHLVQPWHIILLAFGLGAANAFDAPARQAFVLEMVEREDLTNAIALNSSMFNSATAFGPAIAGVTYALFGPGWCFTINGITFGAIIAALLAMRNLNPQPIPEHRNAVLADLKEGLSYVFSHSIIRFLIGLVGMTTLFGISYVTLIPAWTISILHGNASVNGLLLSARGVGALISALSIASLGHFKFRGKLLTVGTFVFPVGLFAFAMLRLLPLSLLALVAVGWASILIFNLVNALIQTLTSDHLRGRVMSVYSFTFFGFMPIGGLLAGAVAEKAGEPATIMLWSLISLGSAASIFAFLPEVRKLE